MADRVSQNVGEVSGSGTPSARASQSVSEVSGAGTPKARASQDVAEVSGGGSPNARISQAVAEASGSGTAFARVSQFVVELLIRSHNVTMPPVYPDLPGQPAYDFNWAPEFFVLSDKNPVGAAVNLPLAPDGIQHFELTYQLLRNTFDVGGVEFKTMFGFFGRIGGQGGRFLFKNPHDNTVLGQSIGTTDGVNTIFGPIQRTYGIGLNVTTEPVGYIDPVATFNLYLDGALQSPSTYSLIQTTPGRQQVRFNSTPVTGQAITYDGSYYYYCKFEDDKMLFNEFMLNLFALKKVNIESVRAGS